MNYSFYVKLLNLMIVVFDLTSALANDTPNSAEQLRGELESALIAKDTNAVISLFNSDGGTNDWRESAYVRDMMMRLQAHAILQSNATNVSLSPPPANFQLAQTNEQNGIRTKFNVSVIGMIEVKSENGSAQQLPYGKKGNDFYLAGIIQEKTPGNLLAVSVLTGPDPDSLTYTGSCVYVKGGTEVAINISDKTNRFKTYWGDYIKSCTIQRTSTNSLDNPGFAGWFYFQISEGGKTIFESPQITNELPVVYERKF